LSFLAPEAIAQLAILGFVFFMLLNSAAIMVYVERKVAARIQQRMGPTLVGPAGALQPLADIIKLAMKEYLQPKSADPILFALAPIISAAAAFTAFAVVPFGAETTFFGLLDRPVPLQVADVNVAILWVFAVTSMGVYGIVLAGYSSNSKYSLLGALRSSAQMISYELSYGMAIAAVILLANTMSIRGIVEAQSGGFLDTTRWFLWLQPIGFFIFMTAGVAETNRAPFDFPEAEQELVAGYHTEYSSMSFAMFFLAEYINMVTVSAIATNLYLGGWNGPFLDDWGFGWIWFLLKLSFLLFFYVWMRWTLPRYRYDQLMAFGWKFLLPLSVINLLVTAAGVLYFAG
jgi:NADH-quinone oxidoreductase subunit H